MRKSNENLSHSPLSAEQLALEEKRLKEHRKFLNRYSIFATRNLPGGGVASLFLRALGVIRINSRTH